MENIKNQSLIKIKEKEAVEQIQTNDLPTIKTISSDVDSYTAKNYDLRKLERVDGSIRFFDCKVKELPELTSVKYYADFDKTIESLPKLKTVGEGLSITNCNIRELPSLESVGELALYNNSKLKSIPKLKTAGYVHLMSCTKVSLPNLERVINLIMPFGFYCDAPKLEKGIIRIAENMNNFDKYVVFSAKKFNKYKNKIEKCATFKELKRLSKTLSITDNEVHQYYKKPDYTIGDFFDDIIDSIIG